MMRVLTSLIEGIEAYLHKRQCVKNRARAIRVFTEQLEEISQLIEIKPEHLEKLRDTPLRLASEEIPRLDDELEKAFQVYQERGVIVDSASSAYLRLDHLKEGSFWYYPHFGEICVGRSGEADSDADYRGGMRAELAHAIVNSVGQFREEEFVLDLGVSEYYDFALSLPLAEEEIRESLKKARPSIYELAHLYLTYAAHSDDLDEAALRVSRSSSLSEEVDFIRHMFEFFHKGGKDPHTIAFSIVWQFLSSIAELKECSLGEAVPYLQTIAGKALYDSAIDFSDYGRFIETVSSRLPEYLQD